MARDSGNRAKGRQLSLAGIDLPLDPIYPLFFAILPDSYAVPQIKQTAQQLCARNGLKDTPRALECLHVTLHSVSTYLGPQHSVIAKARQAGASVTFPQFDVTFDHAVNFGHDKERKHPVVLCGGPGLHGLREFYRVLGVAMAKIGLCRTMRKSYTPHITLLYSDANIEKQHIEKIGWTVREFVLVRSLYGLTQHEVLARWPLRGERFGRN